MNFLEKLNVEILAEEILLKARPYFRKNSSTPGLIINFDSSDEDISKAGKYIAMHLHPDVIAHKEYLSDDQKEELWEAPFLFPYQFHLFHF